MKIAGYYFIVGLLLLGIYRYEAHPLVQLAVVLGASLYPVVLVVTIVNGFQRQEQHRLSREQTARSYLASHRPDLLPE